MTTEFYVIVDINGFQRANKTGSAQLERGQRMIPIRLEIPDEVFSPPVTPTIVVKVPKEAIITELTVDVFPQPVQVP